MFYKKSVLSDTYREKLCYTQFSTRIYWNKSLAASELFHMFTQSVKTYTSYCCILKSRGNTWFIKQTKNERLPRSATFTAKFEQFLSKHRKVLFLRGFILKLIEKAYKVFSKNNTPFERSTSFHMKISGNFERFQCFKFEKNFWKTETFFKKLECRFLGSSTKIENGAFPYKTAYSESNAKANTVCNF